jgi:hypothetical protein
MDDLDPFQLNWSHLLTFEGAVKQNSEEFTFRGKESLADS